MRLRDILILAMTIVLADGRTIRAGRPVVKNVAGYDLPKLMVGSYGSLGLITEVTLKLHVRPHAKRTLLIPVDDLSRGLDLGLKCLAKAYVASGIVISKGVDLPGMPESETCLAYSAEGLQADVEAELELIRKTLSNEGVRHIEESDSLSGIDLWASVLGQAHGNFKVRVGLPVKHLPEYVGSQGAAAQEGPMLCDIANGFIYSSTEPNDLGAARNSLESQRSGALALDGYALVLQSPSEWHGELDPWGYTPASFAIMKAIKSYWDPAGILPKAYLSSGG